MKILLSFLLWISAFFTASAQDSWKIHHNGQQKLSAKSESENNRFSIKKTDLRKAGSLLISVKDKKSQKDWIRTILIVDEKDNELLRHAGDVFKIGNSKLILHKAKKFSIFSISLPADPKKAALVRVRRIHLASFNII